MAIVNLAINIPNADVLRVQTAMRAVFGQVPDGAGGFRDMTDAEITEKMRQEIIERIRGIVKRYERERAAAIDPVIDIT